MADKKNISFLIDHIDPLGQGVYKKDDQIYFIPKTLPGEEGVAQVLKSKKNIHFCKPIEIKKTSPNRIESECPHFQSCPGCDFLHTGYDQEIEFKAQSFKRMAEGLGLENVDVIKAQNRLHYRNRVQLHYSKRSKEIGFIKGKENEILEVPQCKIFRPELEASFKNIYKNNVSLLQKQKKPKGHVELYLQKNAVNIAWNKGYAEGGFSQVNSEMNEKLLRLMQEKLSSLNFDSCLDLFGGDGNLTATLPKGVLKDHIDQYPGGDHQNFYSLDLFSEDSLEIFLSKKNRPSYDLFIVDPPRAGFKNINQWAEHFRPKYIAYISCHPATMFRDLKSLGGIQVQNLTMLDLFPSTKHFEAFCLLKLG